MKIRKIESRRTIAHRVHEKLDGAIRKLEIYYILGLLLNKLREKFINDEPITIGNFGTFDSYQVPSGKARDIRTGELRMTKSYRSIQFRADENFRKLLSEKFGDFRNDYE